LSLGLPWVPGGSIRSSPCRDLPGNSNKDLPGSADVPLIFQRTPWDPGEAEGQCQGEGRRGEEGKEGRGSAGRFA